MVQNIKSGASILFVLVFFLSALTALIRGPTILHDGEGNNVDGQEFPVILPQKSVQYKPGQSYVVEADPKQPCLFYMEGLSVVLFDMKNKKSAWASYGGKTPFSGSMQCPSSQDIGNPFRITLTINKEEPGYQRESNNDNKQSVFTVTNVDIILTFNFTQPGYWQLVDAEANKISGSGGSGQWKFPSIDKESELVSGIGKDNTWMTTDKRMPAWDINGFKDYAFSCARTNPIVWANKNDMEFAVGITFNNMQMQLNATYYDNEAKKFVAKFGRKVNDCEPLFSIGTWMGLIVSLLLIAVLSFGFLMLNSVQTMDRFDDPKQKQLVIFTKE